LARIERRGTPKDIVSILFFDLAGTGREGIRAEVARRRGIDPSEITVVPAFVMMPEPMDDTREWLARYAPGGSESVRWGK